MHTLPSHITTEQYFGFPPISDIGKTVTGKLNADQTEYIMKRECNVNNEVHSM